MTAIRALLQEAYLTFEKGRFWGEVAVIPGVVVLWIMAMGFAPALSSTTEPVPVSALRASIAIAGENHGY